ncbi:MAG: hypothetical protein U0132_18315, partial [Gemmatimonadaceae bacterium]
MAITDSALREPAAPTVAAVEVSIGTTLRLGQSVQAAAIARDSKGNLLNSVEVSWAVSSTGILGVTSGGFVTAVGLGSAMVVATVQGVSGAASVAVQDTVVIPLPAPPAPPPGPNGLTVPPALPQVYLNYPYPAVSGATITVPAGGNLQTAL